ncbi:MAG: type II/IV secretion system ATPase subunit [ANME-2 cluster archaeon]|nr:type II/IV secretion system ATPase subunit [ANME-2 cluster archaeon]
MDTEPDDREKNTVTGSTQSIFSKSVTFFKNIRARKLKSLPAYDPAVHGPLIEYEVPEKYQEIERYWVNEPYAFISIVQEKETAHYYVVEPFLTAFEKEMLELVYDDLQDILTLKDSSIGVTKEEVLIGKALWLFDRYHASLDVPGIHKILYYLKRNYIGYGRIHPLTLDQHIEDISCDGVGIPIFLYHSKYRDIETNISFWETELNSFVIKLCQRGGKYISLGEPMVDATMPDGSRLQATLGKEVTTRGSSFTIRKFKSDPITPIDLISFNTCNTKMLAYFWFAIENKRSILFAGGTASGKTSMLNASSLFIPPLSKVVSIEDTREITLHHDNWVAGLTRESFIFGGTGEVSMYDLLRANLRQRPEYIIVGEVRGKEALTLFQAMSTGHTTYSTMHAGDVQTVVTRLENEPINVPHIMMQSLDILCIQIHTFVHDDRVRRTQSVVEVTGLDPKTGNIRINELFYWDPATDLFRHAGESHVLNSIMQSRGWNTERLNTELDNRQRVLDYMVEKKMRDYITVSLVVQAYSTNPRNVLKAIDDNTLTELILQSA